LTAAIEGVVSSQPGTTKGHKPLRPPQIRNQAAWRRGTDQL